MAILKNAGNNVYLKLLGINVGVFIFFLMFKTFEQFFVLYAPLAIVQPWRLVSHMFMHAGLEHLFFNMYALFLFGHLIEQKIGSKRFLIFYLVAGLVAAISYVVYDFVMVSYGVNASYGVAVGASGAIMGLLGLVIMLLPQMRVLFFFVIPMSMRTAGIVFAIIDIVGLFTPGNGVANIAHLGGLVCGLIYGKILLNRRKNFNERFTAPKYKSTVHKSTDPNNVVIELNDSDVSDYLKNGRI